jgi:hypothetical protein
VIKRLADVASRSLNDGAKSGSPPGRWAIMHRINSRTRTSTKHHAYRRRCATRLTTYANARMIRVRMPKFFLGGRLNPTGRIKYPNTKRIARMVSATIMSPGRSVVNI